MNPVMKEANRFIRICAPANWTRCATTLTSRATKVVKDEKCINRDGDTFCIVYNGGFCTVFDGSERKMDKSTELTLYLHGESPDECSVRFWMSEKSDDGLASCCSTNTTFESTSMQIAYGFDAKSAMKNLSIDENGTIKFHLTLSSILSIERTIKGKEKKEARRPFSLLSEDTKNAAASPISPARPSCRGLTRCLRGYSARRRLAIG